MHLWRLSCWRSLHGGTIRGGTQLIFSVDINTSRLRWPVSFIFSTQLTWDFKCACIQWFFFSLGLWLGDLKTGSKFTLDLGGSSCEKKKHTHKVHLRGTLESVIMWHNHCCQMEFIVRVRNITSPKSWRVKDNLIFVFSFFLHWCIWRSQRLENIFREILWVSNTGNVGSSHEEFWGRGFQLWGLTGWRISFRNLVPSTIFWCRVHSSL